MLTGRHSRKLSPESSLPKVSYQITVFIRERARHRRQLRQCSNKPMIPKSLTGYNVAWLSEGNLWVNMLAGPVRAIAPSRHLGRALQMVVNKALLLHRSSSGYRHILPHRLSMETSSKRRSVRLTPSAS
jgi:hypothetical protein